MDDPGEAPVDSWMGWSAGSWDGDTLVVKVTGQYDSTWFDRSGNHHSNQMVVTEWFTPMSPTTSNMKRPLRIQRPLLSLGRSNSRYIDEWKTTLS